MIPWREFEADGRGWRAIEAWRGPGGHGLCYFLPLGNGAPDPDDRGDRRAPLEPGERVAELAEARLAELLAGATALTETERRFADPRGRLWLAQNTGPVWAETEVAAGLTGILFTALEGERARYDAPGPHVARMAAADLSAHLERGRGAGGGPAPSGRPAGSDGGDVGGE